MENIDEWLVQAKKVTYEASREPGLGRIQQRLSREPSQMVLTARHDILRAVCCAALASLVAFTAIDRIAVGLYQKQQPTWVAAPSAASPFGLLIGK
ncbi:nickel and cobalt resistance protein CnrY [Cupriavidus metallidurans]|jgi:hypothetical protein|uniref:Nickel-cobalt-cadmium resistance protein NccY n=1 Tax=Alcaligenes xylosoxydans xylosoxydans TaxID=85698 RepID=NCCY_ALCXX|nr:MULTISPECIES: nickel/cobalt/cadmium resistance anti-sigma factor NccY [Burkholderiaceae]Q44581.1 RecName: Full=Nickel-cobalt-cadmium resistance protein NccY [Achromobacter xylosoxidans]AAA65101.1 nccY [Achromobacter xylosoxidans]AVA33744.1 nickel-cobalt-cadmium resistance protein NccY [Cupriavidus metallidurans]KWW32446.1 Nickel and cobalt resistance protein CnrY [Cupriavidus metallidurans]MCA3183410.1 nickel/cobalt/cadmium resistance anti-sigma factor NccY [Cupriavidus sp.]MCA3193979.1 ni